MLFRFNLPIATQGVPKGNKRDRGIIATVPIDIDVDEVDGDRLTHVASVGYEPGVPIKFTEYHDIGGKLYTPVCAADEMPFTCSPGHKGHVNFAFAKALRKVERQAGVYNYGAVGLHPAGLAKQHKQGKPLDLMDLSSLKLERFYEEGVERQIQEFRQHCQRMIVSGGVVYAHIVEPVIAVDMTFSDIGGNVAFLRPITRPTGGMGLRSTKRRSPHAVFALDRLEEALEFCHQSCIPREDIAYFEVRERVFVRDASRLGLDAERASVYASANRLATNLYGKDWCPDHQAVDRLFNLLEGHTENDVPDEIGEVLAALLDLHESGVRTFENSSEAQATRFVSDMWDNRSIDIVRRPLRTDGSKRNSL